MRQLCFAVACITLFACEDILPVENVDLCEGDHPASADCDQCKRVPIPAGCPQCHTGSVDHDCENAAPNGGSGNTSGTGGKSGSNASDGGKPGGAGNGGTGVGGSSGSSAGGDSGSGSSGTGGAGGMSGAGESGAGAGGSAGSAGSPAPKCDTPDDCQNPTPQCNAKGVCVACSNNGACTNRDGITHCDSRSGSPTRGTCVECTANSHCTADPAKPECGEGGQCVACTGNDGCKGHNGIPLCNMAADSSQLGQCVQCLGHADCTDLTNPECNDANVCVPCSGDAACTNRPGTTKCNMDGLPEIKGRCVQCTGDSEDICQGNSCKRSTGACTDTPTGSVGLCEACEADSECDPSEAKCVVQEFSGTTIGAFCFYTDPNSDNCADANSARKPYSRRLTSATTIDGAPGPFCLPATTCQGIHDANIQKDCMNGPVPDNALCGLTGVMDGFCLSTGKCSFVCANSSDCLPNNVPGDFSDCTPPAGGSCQ